MDSVLVTTLAVLATAVIAQAIAIVALRQRIERLQVESRRHLDEAIEEVRAVGRALAARASLASLPQPSDRTTVPSALTGPDFSRPMPLESQTPAERRFATAPKSVVKAAIEFSNPAFDAFAKPPPAFADTQALDPEQAEAELRRRGR